MKKIYLALLCISISSCVNTNEVMQERTEYCNRGFVGDCNFLGLVYHMGLLGNNKDYKKSKEFYTKACDSEYTVGCYNLGSLYNEGKGVRQDKKQAKEYFGKACDLGYQKGCDEHKKLNEQGY